MRGIWKVVVVLCCFFVVAAPMADAKKKDPNLKRIIYIPHDSRPISDQQTADVAKRLGYEVLVPPKKLLGNRQDLGHPDELWKWLRENAKDVDAAIVSSDSMIYGSLVGSRKHTYSSKELLQRADELKKFHDKNPKVQLYVFGSIMRTPRSGVDSGHEEPEYYRSYGSDIFRYTVLQDKREMEGLTRREEKEAAFLEKLIPQSALKDWMGRRERNFSVNQRLIDMARASFCRYLLLGKDDNAPYSRTHMESRHLLEYAKGLRESQFQTMDGIDEVGMLLLTRAVNDIRQNVPTVFVRYNWGRGPNTVPAYSDEKISQSINSAVLAAGAAQAASPEKADLVLAVNTNPNGRTYAANEFFNDGSPREGTKYFADIVADYVAKGYPVALADVAFGNGADNALMEELKTRGLLFKLNAYAGWNTPVNSTGFVIGAGILTKYMADSDVDALLLTRYLDDWAYQANVRSVMARQLTWLRGDGVYGSLDEKKQSVQRRTAQLLTRFVADNLPPFEELKELRVDFPWNRMFEADIQRGRGGWEKSLLKLRSGEWE